MAIKLHDCLLILMASCDSETATEIKLATDPNHGDP